MTYFGMHANEDFMFDSPVGVGPVGVGLNPTLVEADIQRKIDNSGQPTPLGVRRIFGFEYSRPTAFLKYTDHCLYGCRL